MTTGFVPSDEDLAVFRDMSSTLLGVVDLAEGVIWHNDSAARILGYDEGELTGRHLTDLVHPDDIERLLSTADQIVAGSEVSFETRFRCKGGGYRWLQWAARAYSGLIYGAAKDVTGHHEADEAIRSSEELLNGILTHSSAGIYVKDTDLRFVLVNDSFTEPLGLTRAQIIGRKGSEIWPEDESEAFDRAVLASGRNLSSDDVVRTKDGIRNVLTTRFALCDDTDQIVGMAAFITDMSTRRQLELAIDESQSLLETITKASPDIITFHDTDSKLHEVTDVSRRILGYKIDELGFDRLRSALHPDDVERMASAYVRLISFPEASVDERCRMMHADGHWVTLDNLGRSITDEAGRVVGAVAVSRDVTADIELADELQASLQAAERASMAKSEFLSRMSHELRTPLNSVLGFAQLLDMEELTEQHKQAVGHILQAGRHLLGLIDEVLDIARIESGHLELTTEAVALGDLITEAVDLTKPSAEERSVEFGVDLTRCPEGAHVLADGQRLLQVLLNLLSNAVKYNRPNGSVRVTAEPDTSEWIRVTVADTGPGISPDDIERVFEPFDRLGAEQSGIEGTGVGLTLSKHLVERMGGEIDLRSERGVGTTFTVVLPATQAPESAEITLPPRLGMGSFHGGTMRVLHVEDNLANLELVERILSRFGDVHVYAAMHGSLAIELAREHHPDVLLLDLHLPDMSGAEVMDRLRSDPQTADIPVVVVSADATADQKRRLRGTGILAYMTKPIDVNELIDVVRQVSPAPAGGPEV